MKLDKHLVWIDLEMTGVDPARDVILEIATIVTDNDLKLVAEGPNIAINQPEEVLSCMDDWCMTHHRASGLIDRAEASSFNCRDAEQRTLEFLQSHCEREKCPLCGNSVWQDRRFIAKYMPSLSEFFHYRNIDVSSIKELAKRWYPSLPPFQKQKSHLALMDIKESVNELKYYRENIFLKTPAP
jgi:oligoribonuclease